MQVLIDYLTMSSKIHSMQHFIHSLGLEECDFLESQGRYGWTTRKFYRGVSILFGGREDICIELSGTGCRTVEEITQSKIDWFSFLYSVKQDILNRDVNVSRLDIAGDDREEVLNINKMFVSTQHNRYISKSRNRIWINGDEQAIYFGSKQSDRRLRIYNKALEQGIEEHWIRAEIQMRNENATSFLLNWFNYKDIGRCYSAVLRDFLRFTTKVVTHENYSRAIISPWWEKFLNGFEKCGQLYLNPTPYDMAHVHHFIEKNCASTLKLFLAAHNGDVTDLIDIIEKAKLNKRQQLLLADIQNYEN